MVAYLTAGRGKAERRQVRGVSFWVVPMPMEGTLASVRRKRRWRELRRMGIRRGIVPPEWAKEAEKWGIRGVEVYPLRRAVWEQMLPRQGNTALIRAGYIDAAVRDCAAVLARRFRYLRLETGWGTEELQQELLLRYGLSIGGGTAEMTVSFGGKPAADPEICLGEDCARWQRMEYEEIEGLEGWEFSEELLCTLFQSGGVKKEVIRVKRLTSNA